MLCYCPIPAAHLWVLIFPKSNKPGVPEVILRCPFQKLKLRRVLAGQFGSADERLWSAPVYSMSKIQFHRKLNLSRCALKEYFIASTCNRSSSGRSNRAVRIVELRSIQQIEKLRAELELLPFPPERKLLNTEKSICRVPGPYNAFRAAFPYW